MMKKINIRKAQCVASVAAILSFGAVNEGCSDSGGCTWDKDSLREASLSCNGGNFQKTVVKESFLNTHARSFNERTELTCDQGVSLSISKTAKDDSIGFNAICDKIILREGAKLEIVPGGILNGRPMDGAVKISIPDDGKIECLTKSPIQCNLDLAPIRADFPSTGAGISTGAGTVCVPFPCEGASSSGDSHKPSYPNDGAEESMDEVSSQGGMGGFGGFVGIGEMGGFGGTAGMGGSGGFGGR